MVVMQRMNSLDLMQAVRAYPDVLPQIIVKADISRLGTAWTKIALREASKIPRIRYKSYGLFSYDLGKSSVLADKIPERFFLEDGTEEGMSVLNRTVPTEQTPYLIDFVDDEFVVKWNGEKVAKIIDFTRQGRYCYRCFPDGTPYESYAAPDGRSTLVVCLNKHCDYFSKNLQCLYCDITPQAGVQKKGGEVYELRKEADRVAEVVDVALHEPQFRGLFITGGTILGKYQGLTELEWYCSRLEAIRKRRGVMPPALLQIQALDDEGWKRLKVTGITAVHPNIEVYDKRLFEIFCPGKAQAVGYDEWIKRTINAGNYFGGECVNPSIVAGVEMAQPWGFQKWGEAVKSTLGGIEHFMRNGILPRAGSYWCREPNSKLAGQPPIPLEYYIELGKGYLELREKYGFVNCPPVMDRWLGGSNPEWDFEVHHGHTAASLEAEKKSMVKPS